MRWLGLRVRIVLALVVMPLGACLLFTNAINSWAKSDANTERQIRVMTSVEMDMAHLSALLERNPDAAAEDLDFAGIPATDLLRTESVLIPLPTASTEVDPASAYTYSDLPGVDLVTSSPQCLQPENRDWMTDMKYWWTTETDMLPMSSELCENYVIGYGQVQVDGPGQVHAWLIVQAMPTVAVGDQELSTSLLFISLIIMGVAVLGALILAELVVSPLTKAIGMTGRVAAGDLSVRLPVRGRDQVARLSAAVNSMADRLTGQITELEQANETQRRFVADVAHELRTPTAALLASAEALEHPRTRDEAALLVAPQLRRLAGLTEDLLEINRIDAGRAEVMSNRIDLLDLLNEVVEDCGAPESVRITGTFPIEVSTDPARLRIIVRNLLANALQHGAPPVQMMVDEAAGQVTVAVRDAGPGVPVELRERVFDRFVRADEARHGSSSGLGLAIATENARLLSGSLTLHSDGRTFVLELPLDAAP